MRTNCTDCPIGQVSTGGECTSCNVPGSPNLKTNTDRSACDACPAGKQANEIHSGCTACTGNQYSVTGVCKECVNHTRPDADRTSCQPCQTVMNGSGYGGRGCGECLKDFYNPARHDRGTAFSCSACPPGAVCLGGPPSEAAIYALKDHWIDEQHVPPGATSPVVYACFSDHCAKANGAAPGCAAEAGAGCCAEGHEGMLCETCSDGYIKQADACIACAGNAWLLALSMFGIKSAALLLVIAQLLAKAATKSYTATTAFGTIIFTVQTVGLVVADSFQDALESSASALAGVVDILQLAATPDKQTPEKCAFPTTLFFEMLVTAVLQPAYAFALLAAVSLAWHKFGCSCSIRRLCDAKQAVADCMAARLQAKSLTARWAGGGVLLQGTWARVQIKPQSGPTPEAAHMTRTVALSDCDPAQIFVSRSTLAAPASNDFEENDPRQLRRLLRGYNIATTATDTKPELLHVLRFHVDCDDALFDNSRMPKNLQRYQILQACMHLLMYFFAPCTRAFEAYWLCRSLAGSGDPNDPRPEYREEYLKHDMSHACWHGEHLLVLTIATLLWLVYAVAFPLTMAWVIAKDKAAAGRQVSTTGGGNQYWHSTRPLVEKWWFPLVAHLQPRHWWFFLVEFFRKLWVNFLYLRGHRSDDGFNWKLSVAIYLILESLSQQFLAPRVYKKAKDTRVDLGAKQFLVVVLMLAMWFDLVGVDSVGEGEPRTEGGGMAPPPGPRLLALLVQVAFGLPGLAPLVLNKLFARLDRKATKKADAGQTADGADPAAAAVVRVHQDPPALTRLRQRWQTTSAFRAATPERATSGHAPAAAAPRAVTPPRRKTEPRAVHAQEGPASTAHAHDHALDPGNFAAEFMGAVEEASAGGHPRHRGRPLPALSTRPGGQP